jgi:hypothetical protein
MLQTEFLLAGDQMHINRATRVEEFETDEPHSPGYLRFRRLEPPPWNHCGRVLP